MDLYRVLWNAFSLEKRSLQELLDLSCKIDQEKMQHGSLSQAKDELSIIAAAIVAFLNEESTYMVGKDLCDALNQLILRKSASDIEPNEANLANSLSAGEKTFGMFRVRQTKSGYVFDLVAENGEILLTSEVYSRPESCFRGIQSVKRNSRSHVEDQTEEVLNIIQHPKYKIFMDRAGDFRFRLHAANGETIAVSEGYKNKRACMDAINKVKEVAGPAEILKS